MIRMFRGSFRAAVALAGLAMVACAGTAPPAARAQAGSERSLVDHVAVALSDGARAEAAGPAGARDLADISRLLHATGAHPAEESAPSLDRVWSAVARRHGETATLPPDRGRPLGPAYRRARIGPGGTASLQQLFLAGQRAEIALMPNGPAALVLEVNDAEGRRICTRRAEEPPANCAWLPVYTTRHSITIKNEGRAPADYFLVVN
jgi:hypothetical protein